MVIQVVEVPQYMSKKVNVIMINGKPLCTCRGNRITQSILAKIQGYGTDIKDERINKLVSAAIEREEKNGKENY